MVRKRKKDNNPYLLVSRTIEQFDFIEEIYPEVEVNRELIPVSLPEFKRAAEPFPGTALGECLRQLCRFLEELEHRKCLEAEEIVEAYLAKEEARCYIRQEKSRWEDTDHGFLLSCFRERLESLGRARELAQRSMDQAGSYYRQMRGKQVFIQVERFSNALRKTIQDLEKNQIHDTEKSI